MNKRVISFFLGSCFALLMIATTDGFSGQAEKYVGDRSNAKKAKQGKPCKGFDPKIDVVIESDKKGNCVLYHRGQGSPGVSFIYDQDGELWTRVYGKDLQ